MFTSLFSRSPGRQWRQPFEVLRAKWHEVPAGEPQRRSTRDLVSASDGDLAVIWEHCHEQQTADYSIRGWYHALYRDVLRGKRVLDVGSGFGIDALSFAKAGADVTCADVVPSNLELLERLARHQGIANIRFHYLETLQSLQQLPADFDVMWCQGSMHHAPEHVLKEETTELLRHLRPNGRWIQLAYPKARWEREGRRSFETWGDCTDGGAPWTEWYDLDKVLALLAPARFETILNLEFHNRDFIWFDLQRIGEE